MDKRVVAIITSAALMLLYAASGARAQMQQPSEQQPSEQQQQTEQGGGGGMMGRGMMGRGMMGQGRMMRGMARGGMMPLRIIFALMDADGDGTISLQEWQTAHERIFKAMNTTHDGRLTMDQIRAFMTGQTETTPQQGQRQ